MDILERFFSVYNAANVSRERIFEENTGRNEKVLEEDVERKTGVKY